MTKKENEENILYSCRDCGDKVYFKIKELELKDRDHVYVRFKTRQHRGEDVGSHSQREPKGRQRRTSKRTVVTRRPSTVQRSY